MAKLDEISSTERLLELIRSDGETGAEDVGLSAPRTGLRRLTSLISNPISFGKAITVGIDLGHDDLKMVKINRISAQKYEMLDYARVPFDPDISRDSPRFYQFLKPTLAEFCGRQKNADLWCTISSARVETRHLQIPKVPQKQIANSVYWAYQKEAPFNEREKVFDFEILGTAAGEGAAKIDVLAYTAPYQEVKALKDLFAKAGYPLTGVSIVPFAFQTLLRTRRIETDEKNVSSLYIGRDWSRIDIFSNGTLMLSRGIKAGVRTMIEALREKMEERLANISLVQSSEDDERKTRLIREKINYELEHAQQLFFGLVHESPPRALKKDEQAIRERKLFQMILPALERLVRQVERTLRHYALNYDNARVGKIYISSGVSPHQRILDYIGEELGLPTEAVNPFASGAHFLTMVPWPDSVSEQSSFAPAMGMALATNSLTPNFLYTYQDKKKAARSQRVNRGVFAAFFLLIAVCVGITFYQDGILATKEAKKSQLERQLQSFNVRIDQNLILKLLGQNKAKNRIIAQLAKKYQDVAIIGEITRLTPPNIRLLNISATLSPMPGTRKGKKARAQKILVLEGLIRGSRLDLEPSLLGFLMTLKNSRLFGKPVVNRKSLEPYKNGQALHFTAQLELS